MSRIAVDYSWTHPDPAALKAAGVSLVIRYTTGTKALTAAEAQALRAEGIGIALVHETDAGRVNTGGSAGGQLDALQAKAFGDGIGYPVDAVVFYACDTAANLVGARAYFQGVRSVKDRLVGWYGGLQVGLQLKAEGLVDIIWVANAASWSGFYNWPAMAPVVRANPNVSMLQSLDHPLPGIAPSSYDYDEVLQPFPAWGLAGDSPAPAPVPDPSIQHPSIDIGDEVNKTDITGIRLDDQGRGVVDVRGVTAAELLATEVFGGSDPLVPKNGYQPTPVTRVLAGTGTAPARVVITGGVPNGVYTLRVVSS